MTWNLWGEAKRKRALRGSRRSCGGDARSEIGDRGFGGYAG